MEIRLRILALIATCLTSPAWATPYFEIGDAGESLESAQTIGAGVDVIFGSTTSFTADLYSFFWTGGALMLDTFGSVTDTQLFLFNAAGQGVWANDQASATESDSLIVDPALAAGQYFVGVSLFDFDPFSVEGEIFPSAPFNGLFGPSNDSPLDHWARRSGHSVPGGSYVVNFNKPTGIPEPPTIYLMIFAFVLARIVRTERLTRAIRKDRDISNNGRLLSYRLLSLRINSRKNSLTRKRPPYHDPPGRSIWSKAERCVRRPWPTAFRCMTDTLAHRAE